MVESIQPPDSPPEPDKLNDDGWARFQPILIGALVVMILIALAALWLMESRRRRGAEAALAEVMRREEALRQVVQMHMTGDGAARVRPVQRGDLPTERVLLDGRSVEALRLGAGAGIRLGFEPGDVIVVSPAPESAPATPEGASPAP